MKALIKILSLASLVSVASSGLNAEVMRLGDNSSVDLLADASVVYTDNLFRRAIEESDTYLEFSPGFEIKLSRDAAITASVRYQHRFTLFDKYSELDGDYSDLSGQIAYNSGRMLTSGYIKFEELASNSVDANLDGVLVERDVFGIGGSVKYGISRLTSLKVGIDHSETDYDLARFTDHESLSVPISIFYKVRPKVDLTAGMRFRNTDTDGLVDYDDVYYFVGVVGEFLSPVIFADVTVGIQEREFDGINYSTSTASYDLTFTYTGGVKTIVYVGLSRDYRTSAIGGSAYTFTTANLGASYRINDAFSVDASIVAGETDYEQNPRAEDITLFQIGASYNPNEYLTLRASYSSQNVDGKDAVFSSDYSTNTFRVSASVRY